MGGQNSERWPSLGSYGETSPPAKPFGLIRFARVQRTPDSKAGTVHYVCVNLRRCHIHVPKQILHAANVGPALKQMGGKAMAQRMGRHALVQARLARGVTHG